MSPINKESPATNTLQKYGQNPFVIYAIACAVSLILFLTYCATDDILNDDGIDYIYAAHALAEGLPEKAKSYRPEFLFYGQISLISSLSGLELTSSALLLSLFWQLFLATGFMAVMRSLDSSTRTQVIALALFFSIMSLNELRPHIIRDFGFWALQLWAVWAAITGLKKRHWGFALLWLFCCSASIIYRIEGIAYLILIPFLTIISAKLSRRQQLMSALGITLIITLATAITFGISSKEPEPPGGINTHRLQSLQFSVLEKWQRELKNFDLATEKFEQQKIAIAETMPNKWAKNTANDLVIGGLIFHVLVTLLKTTNTPLLLLSLCKRKITRPFITNVQEKLIANYLLTGIIIGLTSVYTRYFVDPRYLMLPAIILCIPITLLLSQTYQNLSSSQNIGARFWRYALFTLPLLACAYSILHQSNDKLHIKEAGQWIKANLSDREGIYFNDRKVAFYTDDYRNDSFKWEYTDIDALIDKGYHYAVLYKPEDTAAALQQSLTAYSLKTFTNSRGHSVIVYELPQAKRQ